MGKECTFLHVRPTEISMQETRLAFVKTQMILLVNKKTENLKIVVQSVGMPVTEFEYLSIAANQN